MKRWVVLVAAVSVLVVPRVGSAQPGPEGEPPPIVEEVPPPAPSSGEPPPMAMAPAPPPGWVPPVAVAPVDPLLATFDAGVLEDANSGRNWLSPTALLPPKGTFTFSDFQLFIIGASYSVTDEFQLSASTLLPIVADLPFVGMASGKLQLLRTGRMRGAAQLTALHVSDDGDSATAFAAGGALTLCIDVGCHSYASGYLGVGFAFEDNSSVPIFGSAALLVRVARHVKLMFEVDTGGVIGELDAAANGVLFWYGVRFTSRNIGVDLGFVKPICDGCEIDELPLGLPFIALSYRAL